MKRHGVGETVVAGMLLLAFPFFFFGGPGYHAARSFKAAWDLGHILFFFLAVWLVIRVMDREGPRFQNTGPVLLVLGLVLASGILIELLQGMGGGRTVDAGDVYRDLLGCLVAFAVTGSLPLLDRKLLVFRLIVVALVLHAAWPLYPALYDEQLARRQFPLLADFETPFEQNRWKNTRQFRRQREIVRHGRYAARVQLSTATYSGVSLFYFPHDWSGWRTLHFSVYNPQPEVLMLHARIHDALHGQYNRVFSDRFHTRFALRPGWNDLRISLQDVRTAPADRLMDMTRVEGFGLFVVRQPRAHVLYLDSIYLSR